MTTHDHRHFSLAVNSARNSIRKWQDRIRDPSLTVLLVLQICTIFLGAPLAAKGLPLARALTGTLLLAVLVILIMLSQRWGAIALLLLGLAAVAASLLPSTEWSAVSLTTLRRGGDILAFFALAWVVAHAVYAPGRITSHRLQGAVVLYLTVAMIFVSVFGLIWELSQGAFVNLLAPWAALRKLRRCSISASPR